jgi:hypothetical protein
MKILRLTFAASAALLLAPVAQASDRIACGVIE